MKLKLILETIQDQIKSLSDRLSIEPETITNIVKQINSKHWKYILNQWYQNEIQLANMLNILNRRV